MWVFALSVNPQVYETTWMFNLGKL
jgi:hypothetical protein